MRQTVVIGGLYQHFKGNLYKVVGLAVPTPDIEKLNVFDNIFKGTDSETRMDFPVYQIGDNFYYSKNVDRGNLVIYTDITNDFAHKIFWAREKGMFEEYVDKGKGLQPRFELIYPRVKGEV